MTNLWAFIVALVGGLVADIFIRKGQVEKLEQKVAAGKYENEDSNLQTKQAQLATTVSQEEKQIAESKEPTSAPQLTPEQVENYWNNKK